MRNNATGTPYCARCMFSRKGGGTPLSSHVTETRWRNRMLVDHAVSEPFGYADVETETRALRGNYREVYLADTSFAADALDTHTYLIVGRRGSGKTALARYFAFQKQIPRMLHIPIGETDAYPRVLAALSTRLSTSAAVSIPFLMRVWNWAVVMAVNEAVSIASSGRTVVTQAGQEDAFTAALNIINDLLQKSTDTDPRALDGVLDEHTALRDDVLMFARSNRIVVTLDTLEKYDTRDAAMMNAMAALIQYAAQFQLEYAPAITLKVFIPGEIYNHLKDTIILNPIKSLRRPLHLNWSISQLARLIAWRFWRYLRLQRPYYRNPNLNVRWAEPADVYRKLWLGFFASEIVAAHGDENSLIYVLRHTQMRPRQLIYICNAIARRATARKVFPQFGAADIVGGVDDAMDFLISDLINAYGQTVPRLPEIINSFSAAPAVMDYGELEKRAEWSRDSWPEGHFSVSAFLQLMAEVGVIGRVTATDGTQDQTVRAEFAYSTTGTLVVGRGDTYAVHPMFHRRLNIARRHVRVLPGTPDDPGDAVMMIA